MFGSNDDQEKAPYPGQSPSASEPIEPKKEGLTITALFKLLIFFFFILYVLVSFYRVQILTRAGSYLIMAHPPEKSDLIVCMGGENIERGLAAADLYLEGLAPRILISQQPVPDGYELLEEKGIDYPRERDLLEMLLLDLGIPEQAIILSDSAIDNTWEEALWVREEVVDRGLKSIILVTSPTHSRRAWLVFRKIFEGSDVRVLSFPSQYSGFNAGEWWKERKYLRDVLLEYEKLFYYIVKYNILSDGQSA
jgi:uncharacterized SAM-binding protein YcdF (DUF218 family)